MLRISALFYPLKFKVVYEGSTSFMFSLVHEQKEAWHTNAYYL